MNDIETGLKVGINATGGWEIIGISTGIDFIRCSLVS
jgi:hypothetical protein